MILSEFCQRQRYRQFRSVGFGVTAAAVVVEVVDVNGGYSVFSLDGSRGL